MVAAPQFNWTGFYTGLFAGYGWGKPHFGLGPFTGAGFNFITYDVDSDGFFGGGHAGYNWQSGLYVLGVEGEIGYLGLKGNAIHPASIPFGSDTSSSFKSDFYAAIAGRGGIATNRWLFYAKGGAAFLDASAQTIDTCSGGACGGNTANTSASKILSGWTVGGGAEWAPNDQWSLKVEYLYFDFGDMTVRGLLGGGLPSVPQKVEVKAQTVKLGINYRFATGSLPRRP